jgi:two-component system NarL family response regulator
MFDVHPLENVGVWEDVCSVVGAPTVEALLAALMRFAVERTGASYAALILDYDGQWVVRSSYSLLDESMIVHCATLVDAPESQVPARLVRQVAQLGQAVALDVDQNVLLVGDDVQSVRHKALGLPLTHVGRVVGMLYLDQFSSTYSIDMTYWLPVLQHMANHVAGTVIADRLRRRAEAQVGVVEAFRRWEQMLVALRERERRAHELHDTLGQAFDYMFTQASITRDFLSSGRLSLAASCVSHLIDLVRTTKADVQAFKRDTKAQSTLPLPSLPASGLLPALQQHLQWLEAVYDLRIEQQIDPQVVTYVLTPLVEARLLRIVQEALDNVRKYAGVTTARVSCALHEVGLEIAVVDEGCGFDLAQLHDPSADGQRAQGYGFSSMRGYAEELSGALRIETAPGAGTRVIVYVPLLSPSDSRLALLRVLLMGDNRSFLQGLEHILLAQGVQVFTAARAEQAALEQTRAFRPDIVLMDSDMLRDGRVDVIRLLQMECPNAQIVMLVVSEDDALLFEAMKNGAVGYLCKTAEPAEISAALIGLTQGEAPLSPRLAMRLLLEVVQREGAAEPSAARQDVRSAGLSARQRAVLTLVAEGYTYKEVGRKLGYSESTIKYYMGGIIKQLHMKNRAAVVAYARRHFPRAVDE